jgi:hypothetical protein
MLRHNLTLFIHGLYRGKNIVVGEVVGSKVSELINWNGRKRLFTNLRYYPGNFAWSE